jgi:hypothetical protein
MAVGSAVSERMRSGHWLALMVYPRILQGTEVVVDCENEEDKSRQEEQLEKDEGQGR